jgi:putative glutamine amidotransferase
VGSQVNYLDALARAGGLGVVVAPSEIDDREADRLLEHFDGLLLTGGPDLDPSLYGQQRHRTVYGNNPCVDRFEMAVCSAARRTGVPVLAICRGLQILNVAFGGTLHQHISDRPGGCDHGRPGESGGRSPVALAEGSRIEAVVGGRLIEAACYHHQAVDRLGDGLVATGWTEDGVVEVVEVVEPDRSAGGWLLAVQWHPETVADREPAQQAIFDAFVSAAASPAAAS